MLASAIPDALLRQLRFIEYQRSNATSIVISVQARLEIALHPFAARLFVSMWTLHLWPP